MREGVYTSKKTRKAYLKHVIKKLRPPNISFK